MGTADRYISRNVNDENFQHVLSLFVICKGWAMSIEEGHKIDFNDINMVQLPVQIAEALLKHIADGHTPLADACRKTLDAMEIMEV
jgi:hypothetical protein